MSKCREIQEPVFLLRFQDASLVMLAWHSVKLKLTFESCIKKEHWLRCAVLTFCMPWCSANGERRCWQEGARVQGQGPSQVQRLGQARQRGELHARMLHCTQMQRLCR